MTMSSLHAPTAVKEALDSGDLSINQGYNITRQVRELPEEQREEAAALAFPECRR